MPLAGFERRDGKEMIKVLRIAGAIVAGLALSFVLVILVEIFSEVVYPAPKEAHTSMEAMCAHVAAYPPWILAMVVPMWGTIAFLGTWVARRLGNFGSGIFVGTLLFAAAAWNVIMLPYYVWFKVVILIAVPAAVLLGLRCWGHPKVIAVAEGG